MKVRATVVALSGFVLVLVGCGKSVDESTVRACNLLASAEDAIADATNAYVDMGKPAGGSEAVRAAFRQYPGMVAQAADEALSGPADLSASFQESKKNAVFYVQAVNEGDYKSGGVFAWAIQSTVDKCRAAGVDMPISEIKTST